MSAFLSYNKHVRQSVCLKYPTVNSADITRIIAQMWHNESDDIKRPYLEQEQIDRMRYHEKMLKWKEDEESAGQSDFELEATDILSNMFMMSHMKVNLG